ncbi:LysE family translocator [Pseudemcibacter aquimaris]|uniref:LysE family translocator n=1 Tax=Pseudemcibacter aquimaris TaxID=2857064 RepID=UPI002011D035|nr:LysE family translocator [Pseudemcibacter aquimaris]MCC3861571.1 LysE family translocator [Pseudemcibacter aquimaris]WDU58340.1 LysE family translocator [Pseudemcibacter aquimaris]
MLPIELLTAFFVTAILLGITPGPDNIFVLTQSAVAGRRAGVAVTLGLLTGIFCHTVAVALGIAVIFQTSPVAFTALKIFGVGYLLYLAWGAFNAGDAKINGKSIQDISFFKLYRRGIIMNISNPKIAVFFLAFLPQFADPALGNIPGQILLLGTIFNIATLIVFMTICYLAGSIGDFLKSSDKAQTILNRIAGTVFVGLALKLAVTSNE